MKKPTLPVASDDRSFTIPRKFLDKFKGDVRVVIPGHGTQGIVAPLEFLNEKLVSEIPDNFEVIIAPKQFG